MPDWKAEVQARLASLNLSPTREAEIVDALSQDLDDRYRESIAGGASPEEASRLALAGFQDRNVLIQQMASLRAGPRGAAKARLLSEYPRGIDEVLPGRYIAYQSQESGGRDEVYVRSFPAVDQGRWQISTGGGTRPAWSRKGTELFYLDDSNTLHAVPVDTSGPALVAGTPAKVFDTKYAEPNPARHYDVSPDGRWFLVLKPRAADANATPAHMIAVARWFDELEARVP